MADLITLCGALLTLLGFLILFAFIRRLGILELDAALMNDDFQRPKLDPQPMIEVKNPFEITLHSAPNLLGCVKLAVSCTQSCLLSCYWKVKKDILEQKVLASQSERDSERDDELERNANNILQTIFQENCETVVSSEIMEACSQTTITYNIHDILKKPIGQVDFTSDPLVYDLVVVMELTKEIRDQMDGSPCSIVAMLVGINLTCQEQNFKPYLAQQYIQSFNGKLFKMKKLFLEELANNPPSEQSTSQQEPSENMCIVCQMMPISRAIIPCGHACLCLLCFDKMNTCPMCRNIITSSFILREEPNIRDTNDQQFSEILKSMNPVEIIRGIYNAS